jgi:membrane protease YdiL (CAAX protease family)
MTRKFDWLLGAAFLAAPFYWWVLTLFVNSTSEPAESSADTKRLLLLVIVYPILEEIVFRGALQGWVRRKSWGLRHRFGVTTANILTSIVFAAFHLIRRPNIWSAGVMLPGLVFGFFRDRYGNLYAPMALHIFYNAGLIWLFRV